MLEEGQDWKSEVNPRTDSHDWCLGSRQLMQSPPPESMLERGGLSQLGGTDQGLTGLEQVRDEMEEREENDEREEREVALETESSCRSVTLKGTSAVWLEDSRVGGDRRGGSVESQCVKTCDLSER